MSPYKIIDENETHITYEYRSAYTWTLYAVAIILGVGLAIPSDFMTMLGGLLIAAYFIAKLGLGSDATARIKRAMQVSAAEISGNKLSFSNPLRIRVPK